MLRLTDILRLERKYENINVIKAFLEKPRSHIEYQAAFLVILDILFTLNKYEELYLTGKNQVKDFLNQPKSDYIDKILKIMFDTSMELQYFSDAKYYLDQRRNVVSFKQEDEVSLDEIKYKKALNMEYEDDIERLLTLDIKEGIRKELLIELYYIKKSKSLYNEALKAILALEKYDLDENLRREYLKTLISLKRYNEVLEKAKYYLKRYPNDTYPLYATIYSYFELEDYYKAVRLEADYESFVEKQDDDFKRLIYPLYVNLYEKIDNKLSINLYRNKLKKIKLKPTLEVEEKAVIEKEVVITKTKTNALMYLEFTSKLISLVKEADPLLSLRDFFRLIFIEIEKIINFFEVVLYIERDQSNLFHYKVERLYDKRVLPSDLEHTYISEVFKNQNEITDKLFNLRFQKNITNQKEYVENMYIYSFYLNNKGVISFHFKENIVDPSSYYDILKVIKELIDYKLTQENVLKKLKSNANFYDKLLKGPLLAYREMTDHISFYNDEAKQILDVDTHTHFETFLQNISYDNVKEYEKIVKELFQKVGSKNEITYKYLNKTIKETLYSIKRMDETIIMSVFEDNTDLVNETKTLVKEATLDEETGLLNKNMLKNALNEILKDKASFILIDFYDEIKTIYGYDEYKLFFKEFAQITKKFFQDGTTYRTEYNKLLVVLPINDIRSVTNIIRNYINQLEQYDSQVLKFEKFKTTIGILRYPVVTVERNLNKLLRYLHIAVEKARRNQEGYQFFSFKDYETEVFEQEIINHLNLAIETRSFQISFKQITDLRKNIIWQYESSLKIPNLAVDGKYISFVAKKRNRIYALEMHHIELVLAFLLKLEEETERLIKVLIPISKETFLQPNFNKELIELINKYEIPSEFISINLEFDLRANYYVQKLIELTDFGVSIHTNSLDLALNYDINYLHQDYRPDNQKWQAFLNYINKLMESSKHGFVVRNVKTKLERERLQKLDVSYIEGPIYIEILDSELIQKIKESL